jgi:hypothetical protein
MMRETLTGLPAPSFAGGTRAMTTAPVAGQPRREYADVFVPGQEELEPDELRVTVLGSGNPWVTLANNLSLDNAVCSRVLRIRGQRFPRCGQMQRERTIHAERR